MIKFIVGENRGKRRKKLKKLKRLKGPKGTSLLSESRIYTIY